MSRAPYWLPSRTSAITRPAPTPCGRGRALAEGAVAAVAVVVLLAAVVVVVVVVAEVAMAMLATIGMACFRSVRSRRWRPATRSPTDMVPT